MKGVTLAMAPKESQDARSPNTAVHSYEKLIASRADRSCPLAADKLVARFRRWDRSARAGTK